MEQLPANAATHDEPIPALGDRPWDGPDMERVLPIEMMLGLLHQLDASPSAYVALWLKLIHSVGGWPSLTISRNGEEELGLGRPCDAQYRHRERWLHFLAQDLNSDPERRDTLITTFIMRGRYIDNRPADPRQTTRVVRDFLRTEGRILIDPEGKLTEGGGAPKMWVRGKPDEAEECARASKAYFALRRRWRSDAQIKRAVQILGRPTANGWLVLEQRA